jgi:hypothetical protein
MAILSQAFHILEACFFRMTPFRSMLLTLQSGLQRFTPRAQSVPAYAQVLRHSSIALSRRDLDHRVGHLAEIAPQYISDSTRTRLSPASSLPTFHSACRRSWYK